MSVPSTSIADSVAITVPPAVFSATVLADSMMSVGASLPTSFWSLTATVSALVKVALPESVTLTLICRLGFFSKSMSAPLLTRNWLPTIVTKSLSASLPLLPATKA